MQEKSVTIRIKTPTNLVYAISILESHLFSGYDIPNDDTVYLDCDDIEELNNLIDGLQHLKDLTQKEEV